MFTHFSKVFLHKLNTGIWPYLAVLVHIGLGTGLVYSAPRSNLAFLVLISSLLSLYFFKTDNRFKLIAGTLLALLIFPVIGRLLPT